MDVRMVTPEDLPALVEMGVAFYGTGLLPGRFDPDSFVSFWTGILNENRGAIIMGEEDGLAVGTLGAVLYADPCNGDLVAQELFWWVNEGHRGNGSWMLVQAFEAWAENEGAKRVAMAAVTGSREGTLARLYGRKGYREIETTYVKDL